MGDNPEPPRGAVIDLTSDCEETSIQMEPTKLPGPTRAIKQEVEDEMGDLQAFKDASESVKIKPEPGSQDLSDYATSLNDIPRKHDDSEKADNPKLSKEGNMFVPDSERPMSASHLKQHNTTTSGA